MKGDGDEQLSSVLVYRQNLPIFIHESGSSTIGAVASNNLNSLTLPKYQ
ncbi:hypothetical protein CPS_1327 [Colwellia psychrerythraea 34H]|uniref:Uncharacterized protein n=1 Tax=Colwellia psychrerythraea (strain 34H / ATCC BAA-681) TaxID=167879 RepID=Q486E5_COLP3|nr:hypothetical protein CPS_1327 [Colwellia psychrerythraea 34H]